MRITNVKRSQQQLPMNESRSDKAEKLVARLWVSLEFSQHHARDCFRVDLLNAWKFSQQEKNCRELFTWTILLCLWHYLSWPCTKAEKKSKRFNVNAMKDFAKVRFTMCEASITTPTPRGDKTVSIASAMSFVIRSCTCRRREKTSTTRASLLSPMIFLFGRYPIVTRP